VVFEARDVVKNDPAEHMLPTAEGIL
jgi:hypothetical protein